MSEEPYTSNLTDDQIRDLLEKEKGGTLTSDEHNLLEAHRDRALKKASAAQDQIDHPSESVYAIFAAPADRLNSAMGTLVVPSPSWLLDHAAQGRNLSRRQSAIAKRPRDRDAFATLLKRTHEGLRASGKRTNLKYVIEHLWQFDSDDILCAPSKALGPYGEALDPKRTYYDRTKRLVYWRRHPDARPEAIKQSDISKRLSKLRHS